MMKVCVLTLALFVAFTSAFPKMGEKKMGGLSKEQAQKMAMLAHFESAIRDHVEAEVYEDKEKLKSTFVDFVKYAYGKHALKEAREMEKRMKGREGEMEDAYRAFKDKMQGKKSRGGAGPASSKLMMMWHLFLEVETTVFEQFTYMKSGASEEEIRYLFFESFANFMQSAKQIKETFEKRSEGGSSEEREGGREGGMMEKAKEMMKKMMMWKMMESEGEQKMGGGSSSEEEGRGEGGMMEKAKEMMKKMMMWKMQEQGGENSREGGNSGEEGEGRMEQMKAWFKKMMEQKMEGSGEREGGDDKMKKMKEMMEHMMGAHQGGEGEGSGEREGGDDKMKKMKEMMEHMMGAHQGGEGEGSEEREGGDDKMKKMKEMMEHMMGGRQEREGSEEREGGKLTPKERAQLEMLEHYVRSVHEETKQEIMKDEENVKSTFQDFVKYAYAQHEIMEAKKMEKAMQGKADVLQECYEEFKRKMRGEKGGDSGKRMEGEDEMKAKLILGWKIFLEFEITVFEQGRILEMHLDEKATRFLFFQSFTHFIQNVMELKEKAEMMKKHKEGKEPMEGLKEKFQEFAKKMMMHKMD